MGAKTWMLVYADADANARDALAALPAIDRNASLSLAGKLFPNEKLQQTTDSNLAFTCPPGNELLVGCFPGVTVVAAKELGGDYPSKLPAAFIEAGRGGTIYLHAMHSVVDWFACAVWKGGKLQRALSVSPDSGVMEDFGAKLPFEAPFWSGERPAFDENEEGTEGYPLPFHPLELGEAALAEFFGYQLEGDDAKATLDPTAIPLLRLKRQRSWWKIWK